MKYAIDEINNNDKSLADVFKMTEEEIRERKKYLALQAFYQQVKKVMEELEWKLKK